MKSRRTTVRACHSAVEWEGQEYSRKNNKTKNRGGIGTLFGEIMLLRFSYEPLQEAREDGQNPFPLWKCSWAS